MMKVFTALTAALTLLLPAWGAESERASYRLNDLPRRIVLKASRGEAVVFELEENRTTGFEWAAKYDAKLCEIKIDHRGSDSDLCGASGKAVVTIRLLTDMPVSPELAYRRPWEKGAPGSTLRVTVTPKRR